MTDTDWFSDSVEPQRKTILPYWLLGLLILLIGLLLSGCATLPDQPKQQAEHPVMVCYMKYIGKTEEGYTVAAQQCVTPEEFKASQR